MGMIKQGSQGSEVREVQEKLKKLGFPIDADGVFGDKTYAAILTLQTIFGYDQDGIVGPATLKLIEQQAGFGWNVTAARKAFEKSASA